LSFLKYPKIQDKNKENPGNWYFEHVTHLQCVACTVFYFK